MNYRQERGFGLLFTCVCLAVALWLLNREQPGYRYWAIASGAFLLLTGFFPKFLSPLRSIWMWVGHAVGWINSRIVLGFIFFAIVTPTALILKIMHRDPLNLRLNKTASYWFERGQDWTHESMRDQY